MAHTDMQADPDVCLSQVTNSRCDSCCSSSFSVVVWTQRQKMATPEKKAFYVLKCAVCGSVFTMPQNFQQQFKSKSTPCPGKWRVSDHHSYAMHRNLFNETIKNYKCCMWHRGRFCKRDWFCNCYIWAFGWMKLLIVDWTCQSTGCLCKGESTGCPHAPGTKVESIRSSFLHNPHCSA